MVMVMPAPKDTSMRVMRPVVKVTLWGEEVWSGPGWGGVSCTGCIFLHIRWLREGVCVKYPFPANPKKTGFGTTTKEFNTFLFGMPFLILLCEQTSVDQDILIWSQLEPDPWSKGRLARLYEFCRLELRLWFGSVLYKDKAWAWMCSALHLSYPDLYCLLKCHIYTILR